MCCPFNKRCLNQILEEIIIQLSRVFVLPRSGEAIADENEEGDEKSDNVSTKYQLVGVVVHSGQASGGHYYSYILYR